MNDSSNLTLSLPLLEAVFDFSIIQSVLVVGNQKLLEDIKSKYTNIQVSDRVGDAMFDLVIGFSGDVQELVKAARQTLILGKLPVAENSLPENFALWPEVGNKLGAQVFKVNKFLAPYSSYFIQHLNSDDPHHLADLPEGMYYTPLQEAFLKFTRELLEISRQGKPACVVRASDGDYNFLRKIEIGSAKPGKRALTIGYDSINIPLYRKLFWDIDFITISIAPFLYNSWRKYLFFEKFDKFFWKLNFKFRGQNTFKYFNYAFEKLFAPIFTTTSVLKLVTLNHPSQTKAREIIEKHQTPMEVVYALIPSGWLFNNYKNEIGVIAGTYKCELIKLLMQRKEYQEYLGMDEFTDYISVPQKGAADDVEKLAAEIGEKIKNSKAKIFLVGVGSAKLGLLPLLKKYHNAIYIDVGAGIDALAGVVCQQRPYLCEWTDFRINGYDYSKVDFMDQGNPAWDNPEYKTKWID